jgi:uncharacterized repeat protein (TIGR03803 family)
VIKVLHRFGGADGEFPQSGLINVKGMLYGTTPRGGAHNAGAVYRITTSGKEHVVYSFVDRNEAGEPVASLVYAKGALYGTTLVGGPGCRHFGSCGTVFRVDTSGSAKIMHTFGGGDGALPISDLINVSGTLYGTATYGGSGCHGLSGNGCGVIFSITP